MSTLPSTDHHPNGSTVVITHRIREGCQADYDGWLAEIGAVCRASAGLLDWQIIRPIAGLTNSYTIVIRYDTTEHLQQWMNSDVRKQFIEKAQPYLEDKDEYSIHSGLDFWFVPQGGGAKVPVRWKQFLVTWSAIFPLVMGVPWLVVPVMHGLGLPDSHALTTFFVTASVVFLMTYVVMPRYTKWVRKWLFA